MAGKFTFKQEKYNKKCAPFNVYFLHDFSFFLVPFLVFKFKLLSLEAK